MAFEVLNFVDGERTGLEIFWAVRAQAERAGGHYYGDVSASEANEHLQNVAQHGLLSW